MNNDLFKKELWEKPLIDCTFYGQTTITVSSVFGFDLSYVDLVGFFSEKSSFSQIQLYLTVPITFFVSFLWNAIWKWRPSSDSEERASDVCGR